MKKIFLFILALTLSFITFLNLFAEESIVSSEVMVTDSTPDITDISLAVTAEKPTISVNIPPPVVVDEASTTSKNMQNGTTPTITTDTPVVVQSKCRINDQEVDCAQAIEAVTSVEKTGLWIFLILIILGLVGAIIYYFVIKRNYIPTAIPSGIDPINSLNMGVAPAPVAPAPVAPAPVAPAPVAPAPVAPAPVAPAPVAPGTTVNPPLA